EHAHETETQQSADRATHDGERDLHYCQPTEYRDRLGSVEPDPRTFIDQQEDDPCDPAREITQQPRNIFSEAFRGCSDSNRAASRHRNLIGPTFWTETRASNFLTARRTKGHDVLPGKVCSAGEYQKQGCNTMNPEQRVWGRPSSRAGSTKGASELEKNPAFAGAQ